MMKVPKTDFPAIADMYNKSGHDYTFDYIRDHYGMKHPERIIARMKKEAGFKYDDKTRKFVCGENANEVESDQLFMSLDELCSSSVPDKPSAITPAISSVAMDNLVRSLITDRLLELSKYITLDTMSRTIMVDRSNMAADGYKVLIN